MQEQTQFKLSAVAREGIEIQAADIGLIIFNELLANKSKIVDLIISYHFKTRGRVYNLRIEKPVLNNELSGFFTVRYSVGHFNACADIDTSAEESMKILFQVELSTGNANLIGEYIPEREPDEL